MSRFVLLATVVVASVGLLPAWAQPRQWVDDFNTVATYDSNSLYGPCNSGPTPKYTLIEGITSDIYNQRVWSGNGEFNFNDRSVTVLNPAFGRKDFAIIGWLGVGPNCPGRPPIGQTSEPFTSGDICIYGAKVFSPWQCIWPGPNGWDIRGTVSKGGDGIAGVPNVDDDHNGTTDNWLESPAARPTTVNGGYGNKNGTGFQAGWDNAPGIAGVDDDGNGIVDDVGETRWTGSDDSNDDSQRQMPWTVVKANFNTTTLIYLEFDAGSTEDAFSIREILGGTNPAVVEWRDEITSYNYYHPNIVYNWVFCVASHTCYGAMLWHNTDMANPAETLGPVMNSNHTSAADQLVGFGYDTFGGHSNPTPVHPKRQMKTRGNSNFSDAFWVISGSPATYYPSPSADLDADKDVDGFDFLTFSNCYNGSNKPPLAACANTRADLDKDGDVDGFDFLTFSNCYNGSNRKPLAACFPPNLTACGS